MVIGDLRKFLQKGKYKDLPHRIESLRVMGMSVQFEVNGNISTAVWINNIAGAYVVVTNHKAIKYNVPSIRGDSKYPRTNKRLGR